MRLPARRPLVLTFGALAALLVVTALLVPLLFRDRIAKRVKAEINAAVNARVDWAGVDLSLLRAFPNVVLRVERLSVVGSGAFRSDTLTTLREARLVLDAASVVRHLRTGDQLVVRELTVTQPVVRLRVLSDGSRNWDIARRRRDTASPSSRGVAIALRRFAITGGRITLDDEQSRVALSIAGLEESLRGDFTSDRFTLATRTRADTVSFTFGGIPYLSRVGVELNADVDADMRNHRFTFSRDTLRINQLLLAFAGSVTLRKPNVGIELAFSAPSTAFGDMLSLVPAVYSRDFAKLRTGGTMSVTGRVRGDVGPGTFPAFAVRAKVANGSFRDPALPLPVRDISLDLAIDNPGGQVDGTVVALERFHAVVGGRPLDARLVMRTPVSDPDVDLRLTGALDLADLARSVKLQGVAELKGLINANVAVRARRSDVDAGRYDRVAASGSVHVARVAVRTATLPRPVAIDTASLRFTPRATELTALSARVGNSDVRAAGSLDNLLGYLLHDDELRGRASVSSNRFDLNEWRSSEKVTDVIPVPPRVDFTLKASAARVTYGALTLANLRGDLQVKDQRVVVRDLRTETLRGTVVADGFYDTSMLHRPTFDVDLNLTAVDIPAAFAALTTVQRLAPMARWAQGTLSGNMALKGVLGRDMVPVFSALTGKGAFMSERLIVQGAPVLEKLADVLKLEPLRAPTLGALRASVNVADGRVHVAPFVVAMNGIDVTVAGSNGIDQSLNYNLALTVPRALLGGAAGGVVTRLASQAGTSAGELGALPAVQLGAKVTGTVTNPTIRANFAGAAASVRGAAQSIVQREVATRAAVVSGRVDSLAEAGRRRAREEADRLVAEAERQAAEIRAEGRSLAAAARREGNARADSVLARATNPVARMAAQAATDRFRREADQQAERIIREADARADALVALARRRAPAGG